VPSALTPTPQAKPNFSGKWRLLPEPGAAPAPAPLVLRPDLTITQTADTFRTEEPGGMGGGSVVTITYKLDGSETRQTINRADVVTKAWWDGEALVTTVTGQTADWKDTWTLAGARLVIATTKPGRTLTLTRTYEKL
jgi:hypothetical protein